MKYFTKQQLKTVIESVPMRAGMVLAAATTLIAGGAVLAYGPERPTYTINTPADHITFNSITNNPNYGDERNFAIIKDANHTAAGGWKDNITVEDGKEYLVRIYVHNNAAANLNLVATNTRVMANVPTAASTSAQIDAFISADNASPKKIWDSVVMTSDKKFNVGYVAGSADYSNNAKPNGFVLPDSIVTSAGALVGYNTMDGKVQGCFQYSGIATFRVKVKMETPNFTVTKKVRAHGTTAWTKSMTATPGQKVDYQIGYDNVGTNAQDNVLVKDKLPAGVAYVPNTTTLKNATNPSGDGLKLTSNDLTTNVGVNIGNYNANTNAFVRFSATMPKNEDLAVCGSNALVNTATIYTANGSKSDTATVNVTKTNCTPTPGAPAALPTTGPAEVIAGLIGIGAITLGVIYFIRSRKELESTLLTAQTNDIVAKTKLVHTEHTEHSDKVHHEPHAHKPKKQ